MKKSLLFLCASVLGAGLMATLAAWRGTFSKPDESPQVQTQSWIQTRPKITEQKRKVYPYSMVPGGALTVEEARRAMSDPSVRFHYAAVDLTKLRQGTLTADLSGYVSYRFGDKIYWTAKTIRLKAGETIFTDGQHIVRGRCLNRYSTHPMTPIRPHEPTEKIMDTAIEVPTIAMTFPGLQLGAGPVLPPPPDVPVLSSGRSGAGLRGGGGKFFPIVPIIPPIHRHKPDVPLSPVIFPPPPVITPPVAVVPEPSYRWALAVLLLAIAISGPIRQRLSKRIAPGALARTARTTETASSNPSRSKVFTPIASPSPK